MVVRGFYLEGWRPAGAPEKWRHGQEFLDRINQRLANAQMEQQAQRIAHGVFSLLCDRVSLGQIRDVVRSLPEDVREMWPDRARAV